MLLWVGMHSNVPVAYMPAMLVAMIWSVLAHGAPSLCRLGAIWRYVVYLVPSMFIATLAGAVASIVSVLLLD